MFNFPQILWLFLPPHSDLLSTFYSSHDFGHIRSCSVSGTMTLTLTRSQALGIHLLGAFMPLCSDIWEHCSHFYHFGHQNDEHTMNIHSLGKGYKERILQKINLCIWFLIYSFLWEVLKLLGLTAGLESQVFQFLLPVGGGTGGEEKMGYFNETQVFRKLSSVPFLSFFEVFVMQTTVQDPLTIVTFMCCRAK